MRTPAPLTLNTTWNPADVANMTLSGGNLTATATNNGGVRSTRFITSGKYYWECTINAQFNQWTGIANNTAVLAVPAGNLTTAQAGVNNNGGVLVNGSNVASVTSFGGSGGTYCIALDAGNNLIWFRGGASGSWNATSGSANNPATGVGGLSLSSIVAAGGFAAYYGAGAGGRAGTANFGDSGFIGAVPSGFTAGIPASAPAVTQRQCAVTIVCG